MSLFSLIFLYFSFLLVHSAVWNVPIDFNKKSDFSGTSQICGQIVFTNTNLVKTAKSFVISVLTTGGRIASYHNSDKETDLINKFVLVESPNERVLLIGSGMSISNGQKYKLQACFYSTDSDGITEDDILLGIELSDASDFGCSGTDCKLSCGNSQCSSSETKKNCPIDCDTGEKTNNKSFKKNKKKRGIKDSENIWPGLFEIQVTTQTSEEVCAKVFIGHNQKKVAVAYIFTLQVYSDKAKVISFKVNDVDGQSIGDISSVLTYRQVGNNVKIEKNLYITGASICFEPKNNFDINRDVRIGIDLKDQPIECEPFYCKVQCGAGTCNFKENPSNCPIDCDPLKR